MIINGDALEELKKLSDESVDMCVTSPPYYGLRDYGVDGQIGLEKTPSQYIHKLTQVFHEVRRVLKPQGTLWLNIGDSYYHTVSNIGGYSSKSTLHGFTRPDTKGRVANETGATTRLKMEGVKPKEIIGIPWLLAFSLRADGWYLRQDIIWAKPNCIPESVTDRCTRSHEYIFLLTKESKYYFDNDAIKEAADPKSKKRYESVFFKGKAQEDYHFGSGSNTEGMKKWTGKRNKRDVWHVAAAGFKEAHFAVFPEKLIEPCVLAGCPEGGVVLDPFFGSGTTGVVATRYGRDFIGIELNSEYIKIAEKRLAETQLQIV